MGIVDRQRVLLRKNSWGRKASDLNRSYNKKPYQTSDNRYWNVFRVIIVGWVIRYPKNMIMILLVPIAFWIVLLMSLL